MDEPIRAGEPLVLTPAQAQTALQCGPTRLWALINTGEVESFSTATDGASRPSRSAIISSATARGIASKKAVPTQQKDAGTSRPSLDCRYEQRVPTAPRRMTNKKRPKKRPGSRLRREAGPKESHTNARAI